MQRGIAVLFLVICAGCSRPPESPQSAARPATATANGLSRVSGRVASGALVMLESAGHPAAPAEGSAVMDQFSKAFVPDTLFVRVGQPVTFKNSEDQLHNVAIVRSRTGRGVMNVSQNQGDVHSHTFDQVGEYEVSCDVHPGMRAMIVATTTPYAAYADATGAFAFANVPPGQYKLKVLANGRDSERLVDVSGPQVDIKD